MPFVPLASRLPALSSNRFGGAPKRRVAACWAVFMTSAAMVGVVIVNVPRRA